MLQADRLTDIQLDSRMSQADRLTDRYNRLTDQLDSRMSQADRLTDRYNRLTDIQIDSMML